MKSETSFVVHLCKLLFLLVFCELSASGQAGVPIKGMQLLGSSSGWVVQDDRLWWTETAGRTWKDVTPATAPSQTVEGAFSLSNAQTWVLLSKRGTSKRDTDTKDTWVTREMILAVTNDKGQSWSQHSFIADSRLLHRYGDKAAVFFVDATHGWVGVKLSSNVNFSWGVLFATSDGGKSWRRLPDPPIAPENIRFISARDGWMAGGPGGGRLFLTRDGGKSWKAQAVLRPPEARTAAQVFYDVPTFADGNNGTLPVTFAGSNGSTLAIYQTRDGGQRWVPREVRADIPAIDGKVASCAIASEVISAYRNGWQITFASNSNVKRSALGVQPDADIVRLQFTDSTRGWALALGPGEKHSLFATEDGGASVRDITPSPPRQCCGPKAFVTLNCAAIPVELIESLGSNLNCKKILDLCL